MPGEFEIIRRYFNQASGQHPQVQLGIGDDCALTSLPENTQLALSIDTLVENTHFLPSIDPADLAWRLLGSSVSDLAAMGATPAWLTLALTLDEVDEAWLESFSKALIEACDCYGISLIGGDTTGGKLKVLTAQVHGFVPKGAALTRSSAQVGDLIYVSGTLGDSRAGLAVIQSELAANKYLVSRYHRPTPRIFLGKSLQNVATAAIDISDGLLADLGHILAQSKVGAKLHQDQLPLSKELLDAVETDRAIEWALTGGEDFELCFTASPDQQASIDKLAPELGLQLTCIGEIVSQSGMQLLNAGTPCQLPKNFGFDHFISPSLGDENE